MKFVKTLLYLIGLPVLLIVIWAVVAGGGQNFFIPNPGQLVTTFVDTWLGERLLTDVLPSVGRFVIGVVLAILIGIAAGLLIGTHRWLRDLLEPTLEFFRAIPPPVLVPVLMLLVGVDNGMKITVIIFGAIWPVLLNTIEGVRAIDPVASETARSYGITGWNRVRYLVLPSAGPQMMAGIRQSLSIGLILMVISEMFASSSGLGFTIVQFQRSFAVPEMWSGIVVLGLIGVAVSFIFQAIEKVVLRWYNGLREVENAA